MGIIEYIGWHVAYSSLIFMGADMSNRKHQQNCNFGATYPRHDTVGAGEGRKGKPVFAGVYTVHRWFDYKLIPADPTIFPRGWD